jgi:bilirubin oxidase
MKKLFPILVVLNFIFLECDTDNDIIDIIDIDENKSELFIPEIIETVGNKATIELTMQATETEFFRGVFSNTFGYNGNFLGPTLKVYNNQSVTLTTNNRIGEPSTIHKHGLHVPGSVDGGPHQKIDSENSRTEILNINQEASTNWYHPHLMGSNAEHVYKGLAGMLIVEDENSLSLGLPNEYGVNDIPLIVQDRLFVEGVMTYSMDHRRGYLGNTILVNGTVGAYKNVPMGWVRFRILNGSNARFYDFKFEDNRSFEVIATEGGFLESPVSMKSLEVWPGERFEVMVNFNDLSAVKLMANSTNRGQSESFEIIEFRPDENQSSNGQLPAQLNRINSYDPSKVINTREFRFNMDGVDGGMMGINGVAMNMNVINERVQKNILERWVISSFDGKHPFHLHGASFLVLSMNGNEVPLHEQGWKDTVKVDDEAEILVQFELEADDENPYMYHCHILEHEDMGMMGQFTVE